MIQSRSYNPRAQGKVECLHDVLTKEIGFDMLTQKRAAISWVRNLPSHKKYVNNEN